MSKTDLKTAAAYIRVSTDNQTELSPDSQIKVVQQYAKQHGYIIPNDFIFRDDGITGRYANKRPEFNRMIATAKQRPSPFSAVLLWKFSRFARNQEESIFYKSMLRKNDIEVISVSEPVVAGPFGTLIERIIEWSDEYYSIRLSGEVKRGMKEKVERGGAVSIPAFGYDIIDKNYIINKEKAGIVKMLFNDYLNGIKTRQLATKMNNLGFKTTRGNAWEYRTIEYILRNPVYIGKIRWNPERKTGRNYTDKDIMIIDGQHEPIIDEKLFNAVQKLIIENKKRFPKGAHHNSEPFMLHGLVKCSNCGATLSQAVRGTSLQCIKYAKGQCHISHSIKIDTLNKMVLTAMEQALKTGVFNLTIREQSENNTEIVDYKALIDKEKIKLNRIKEAYENEVYTLEEFKERKVIIQEQIQKLNTKIKPSIDENKLRNKIINKNKNVVQQLKSPKISEEEKNTILSSFIDKIVFNRTTTSIELFFYI